MRKTTDINGLKDVARMMLYLPIAETEFDFIVNHPVFQSPYWFDNEKIINIKDSEGAFKEACAAYEQKIDKTEEPLMLMYIFRPSYYLTFLKFSRRFWSANDFAKVLSEAWVEEENPNGDVNVPVSLSAKWFKQCPKETLMNCEEYDTYLCLPDSFVVYRGVAIGRNPEGMSWTRELDGAEWFSKRFGEDGYIIKGIAYKKDVLAYFSRRNESEVLISASDVHDKIIIKNADDLIAC